MSKTILMNYAIIFHKLVTIVTLTLIDSVPVVLANLLFSSDSD